LLSLGFIQTSEAEPGWPALFRELALQDRAAEARLGDGRRLWLAAERLPQFWAVFPGIRKEGRSAAEASPMVGDAALTHPTIIRALPAEFADQAWTAEDALREILRGRLGGSGPVTAEHLAGMLALPGAQVEQALVALETEGFVLRGQFTPGWGREEWCERRLLARIHRYTMNRLRQDIEPVSTADFLRFLFRWQHVHPDTRMQGPQALAAVLAQLEGFETAAVAWEGDLLPARVLDYDPAWLDALCLSGKIVWNRLSPAKGGLAPVKSSPMALLGRRNLAYWRGFAPASEAAELSATARHVAETLARRGALFFEELAEAAGLLKTQLEAALAELVARGLAASDSFMGLRALLVPEQKKQRYRDLPFGMEEAGRWTLVRPLAPECRALDEDARREAVAHAAGVLLQRYGMVFRALLARETLAPAWQDLLKVYRRLEARGELRGGRFVAGQFGEQFALPEAVESLRQVRKQQETGVVLALSAADPLNLAGILTPGGKVPALPGNRVLFRDGIPVAASLGKEVQLLAAVEKESEWEVRNRLLRRSVPPQLRAYLD
jgi:ATP-dependent Lhr-like helicase